RVPVAEEMRGILGVPGVDALLAYGVDDPLIDLVVDQQFAGFPFDEQGDRDAPGTLAADHPVGPLLDHRAEPVSALLRNEARRCDCVECELAKRGVAVVQSCIGVATLILPALFGAG